MVFENLKLSTYDSDLAAVDLPFASRTNVDEDSSVGNSKKSAKSGGKESTIPAKFIYQFRKNLGVNFGGLFVLEKTVFPEFFSTGIETEHEAVKELITVNGIKSARQYLESHWQNYMSDEDWEWLAKINVTSVRIPIGYWIVKNGSYTANTVFEDISAVYKNLWDILKKHYIEKAEQHNISVLLDYHVYPKTENSVNDHFRHDRRKYSGFLKDPKSQLLVLQSLKYIAENLKKHNNIMGIQISNNFDDTKNLDGIKSFYLKAISAIRKKIPTLSIIISDGYSAPQWAQWISMLEQKISGGGSLNLSLESHFYSYAQADKLQLPSEIISNLNQRTYTNMEEFEIDVMVGEYNCCLPTECWSNNTEHDNELQQLKYGTMQTLVFNSKARLGTYFWTYKTSKNHMGFTTGEISKYLSRHDTDLNINGMNFRKMFDKGGIPEISHTPFKEPSSADFETIILSNVQKHLSKCKNQNWGLGVLENSLTTTISSVIPNARLSTSVLNLGLVDEFDFESAPTNHHFLYPGNTRLNGSVISFNDPSKQSHCKVFETGFRYGWSDALEFFKFNQSIIGKIYVLKNIRRKSFIKKIHNLLKSNKMELFEKDYMIKDWEEGYLKGISEFELFAFTL